MKKAKLIFLIICLTFGLMIIGALVMGLWVMPAVSMRNARGLLEGYKPTTEYFGYEGSEYWARYELTDSEWKELEAKLGSFTVKDRLGFFGPYDDLFTKEEMSRATYGYNDAWPIPFTLKKRYCDIFIIPVPSDSGTSVFFFVMLPKYR